jgi:hypothetical protein
VTILKSLPATLETPEPTPDVFAPPTGNSWRGVSLSGILNLKSEIKINRLHRQSTIHLDYLSGDIARVIRQ